MCEYVAAHGQWLATASQTPIKRSRRTHKIVCNMFQFMIVYIVFSLKFEEQKKMLYKWILLICSVPFRVLMRMKCVCNSVDLSTLDSFTTDRTASHLTQINPNVLHYFPWVWCYSNLYAITSIKTNWVVMWLVGDCVYAFMHACMHA